MYRPASAGYPINTEPSVRQAKARPTIHPQRSYKCGCDASHATSERPDQTLRIATVLIRKHTCQIPGPSALPSPEPLVPPYSGFAV